MVIGEQIAECGLGIGGKRKSEDSEIRGRRGIDSDSFRELRPIANTLNRGLRGLIRI